MSTSITSAVATKISSAQYGSLGADVVDAARGAILDGVSNMLAGSREPLSRIIGEYARELGGPPDATVIGHGFKTHPLHAAFANGAACHSMDFEMMWTPPTHPTGTCLPAILALAQQRDLAPRDVVTALAIGFEVQGRLRMCTVSTGVIEADGIHPPGLVGVFGAAASASVLLGLDETRVRHALGIAGSRVGGLSANTGTMTKATHSGNAARMGLEAALLAQKGFTASLNVFDARRGFNHVFFHDALDMSLLVNDFGAPYRMVDPGLIVKRFPAQYTTHWAINAALKLKERHALEAAVIDEVEIEAGADNPALGRHNPATGLDGKFSLEYTVAIALLDGKVGIDSFTDERRFAPDVVTLLTRMRPVPNPSTHALDFANTWARVTVKTKTGERFTELVERPPGGPGSPLPWEDRVAKFRDCAARAVSPEVSMQVERLLENFENLSSVRPLMDLLA
jgi:2-methylcitrate dehydratase PrpD